MCCRRRNRMSPNLVGCFSRIPSRTLFILLARGASCLPPLGNLLFLFSQACVKVVDYRTTCGRLYKPDKWICPINFRRRSVKNSCRCIGAAWLGSRRLVCSKCEHGRTSVGKDGLLRASRGHANGFWRSDWGAGQESLAGCEHGWYWLLDGHVPVIHWHARPHLCKCRGCGLDSWTGLCGA